MTSTAFNQIYFGAGLSKTTPTSFSEADYIAGLMGPNAYYRFFLHDSWAIGVAAGFKSLQRYDSSEVSFFTWTQSSTKLFRLYHPVWLGVGVNSMYMVGVNKVEIPYERAQTLPPQTGIGLSASIYYLINKSIFIQTEVQRWRGTASNRLHAYEIGANLCISL